MLKIVKPCCAALCSVLWHKARKLHICAVMASIANGFMMPLCYVHKKHAHVRSCIKRIRASGGWGYSNLK